MTNSDSRLEEIRKRLYDAACARSVQTWAKGYAEDIKYLLEQLDANEACCTHDWESWKAAKCSLCIKCTHKILEQLDIANKALESCAEACGLLANKYPDKGELCRPQYWINQVKQREAKQ